MDFFCSRIQQPIVSGLNIFFNVMQLNITQQNKKTDYELGKLSQHNLAQESHSCIVAVFFFFFNRRKI